MKEYMCKRERECVCVRQREKEYVRQREKEYVKQRERVCETESVCEKENETALYFHVWLVPSLPLLLPLL